MALSKEIAYLQENSINHWGIANDYAEEKFPMIIGEAIKTMLDNLNTYLETTEITDGRDGNVSSMLRVAKEFKNVREFQAHKESYEKGMLKVVELLMEKGLIKGK